MATSIFIAMGTGDNEREYEVSYAHFHAATPARGWDPGDGGEIELSPFVTVSGATSGEEVMTLDSFVVMYAFEIGETIQKTERLLEDKLYEAACDEDYDSRDGEEWSGGFAEDH
jgi:hypothetical protein